uniref:Myelin protein zero-like 1 n=1 Tax=Mus musculus TaxID=10090 RepID=A0A0A6YXL8_MOUSE
MAEAVGAVALIAAPARRRWLWISGDSERVIHPHSRGHDPQVEKH